MLGKRYDASWFKVNGEWFKFDINGELGSW